MQVPPNPISQSFNLIKTIVSKTNTMKCKNLNIQVTIENIKGFNGVYRTSNSSVSTSYSYYRRPNEGDEYTTHIKVYPTSRGESTFSKFHISLNFLLSGIQNANIFYEKGEYIGNNAEDLPTKERAALKKLLKEKKNTLDKLALQFWTKIQDDTKGTKILQYNTVDAGRKSIQQIKKTIEDDLLAREGVTAVDIDHKVTNGIKSSELAIIIFVEKKRKVPSGELLPKTIKGIKTDVQEGIFTAHSAPATDIAAALKSVVNDPMADPIIGGGLYRTL